MIHEIEQGNGEGHFSYIKSKLMIEKVQICVAEYVKGVPCEKCP